MEWINNFSFFRGICFFSVTLDDWFENVLQNYCIMNLSLLCATYCESYCIMSYFVIPTPPKTVTYRQLRQSTLLGHLTSVADSSYQCWLWIRPQQMSHHHDLYGFICLENKNCETIMTITTDIVMLHRILLLQNALLCAKWYRSRIISQFQNLR